MTATIDQGLFRKALGAFTTGVTIVTTRGEGGTIWTAPRAVARRLRTGQVDINGGPFNLLTPFGGYRQSGNGREFGKYGIEEYLEFKAVQLPVQ